MASSKEHIQMLLTVWSACVLKSARLITSQTWSHTHRAGREHDDADVSQSAIRTEVRGTVLCGGHVNTSCSSLRALFQLLSGVAAPSELLCIPNSIVQPGFHVPDVPQVTIRSWQGQLLTTLTMKLLCVLSHASQYDIAVLAAESRPSGGQSEAFQVLQQRRNAVASHIVLQEFAGASSCFADLSRVEDFVNGAAQGKNVAATRHDVFLPFLVGVYSTGEIHGPLLHAMSCSRPYRDLLRCDPEVRP